MTGALTLVFRAGTDAVRACNGLRTATAGLRGAAMCVRGLRSAGARFQPSLTGDDLLSLMGAQFRGLQEDGADAAGEWAVKQGGRAFARTGAESHESKPWERGAAAGTQDRTHAEAGKSESAETRFPASSAAGAPNSSAAGAARSQASNPRSECPPDTMSEGAATPWPDSRPRSHRPDPQKSTTTLAKILERYWQIDGRAASKRASASAKADSERRPRPLVAAQQPTAAAPPAPHRQNQVRQAEFARRLEAFMSRSPQIAGNQHGFAAQPMQPLPRPALYQDPARLPEVELAGDFAEKLADTLREQAIQHGIDIT